MPLISGPTSRQRDDTRHKSCDQRRPQRDIVPAPADRRHLDVAEAPQQRQAIANATALANSPDISDQCTIRPPAASAIQTATAADQLTAALRRCASTT